MNRTNGRKMVRLNELLAAEYGLPRRQRNRSPVECLVRTILSQNTNDANSHAAFTRLEERFGSWDEVAGARVRTIASAIRVAGLSNIKAPRIRAVLRQIKRHNGRISLAFLKKMGPGEALEYLSAFNGVGPKTAACVLLFSCRMPVFPVDTHILRVSKRLGLVAEKCTLEKAHRVLGRAVPDRIAYSLHLLMIQHGRHVCRARSPDCMPCALKRCCSYFRHVVRRAE